MMITLYIMSFFTFLLIGIIIFPKLLDYVIEKGNGRGVKVGPWKTHLGIGSPSLSKLEKAAIARVGLGANSASETIYWNAFTDSDGNPLNSDYKYKLILSSPLPIKYDESGFCSFTVYGENKFLVSNDSKKYMVRFTKKEMNNLKFPYSILLHRENQTMEEQIIPIPKRSEKFSIALRCYRPDEIMKTKNKCQQIDFPLIQRIYE